MRLISGIRAGIEILPPGRHGPSLERGDDRGLPEQRRQRESACGPRKSASPAENGHSSAMWTRPASDSEIRGIVRNRVEPASRTRPGVRSRSTSALTYGARCRRPAGTRPRLWGGSLRKGHRICQARLELGLVVEGDERASDAPAKLVADQGRLAGLSGTVDEDHWASPRLWMTCCAACRGTRRPPRTLPELFVAAFTRRRTWHPSWLERSVLLTLDNLADPHVRHPWRDRSYHNLIASPYGFLTHHLLARSGVGRARAAAWDQHFSGCPARRRGRGARRAGAVGQAGLSTTSRTPRLVLDAGRGME